MINLCKVCLEKNEYIVPIFEINKETNKIEYQCHIGHDNYNNKNCKKK